jgi:hypothetical protein
LDQLPTFSFAFSSSLRIHGPSNTGSLEPATTDINHAYIAIKLWILLARRKSLSEENGAVDNPVAGPGTPHNIGNVAEITVWNELWPVFEGLMEYFEGEAQTGTVSVSSSPVD